MSPAKTQDKKNRTQINAQQPEPDVTVHDDVDGSIFSEPSHDEIAILAYSFWLDEGQQDGSADEHWLRAERELKTRSGGSPQSSSPTVARGARDQGVRSGSRSESTRR